eukprot:jgi/Tetstr1/465867/TSEL_010484.t1
MVQRFQVGSAQSSVFLKKQPVALQVGDLTPKEIEAGIVAQQDRDAAEKRADDHWRLLQNHAAMQKRDAGRDDVKQQRTLDGQVRSSMSVSALYKALNLERDSEGSLIPAQYFETSFKSSPAELGWRRGHTKLKSFHFVVDAVLDSFESRSAKDSFLDAYVIFRKWEHLKTIRRTKLNARDFEEVLETVCSPEHIQDLAFGSKELRLSSGKAIDIPAVQRKNLQEVMHVEGSSGEAYNICDWVVSYGDLLGLPFQVFQKNVVQRIDAYQQFLKRDMLDHLEPHSSIGSHCLCRLLGGQEHDYHCRDCETTHSGEVDADQYIIDYFDDVSNDKKEDGFAVLSCLHADIDTYKKANPEVLMSAAWLLLDNRTLPLQRKLFTASYCRAG